MRATIQRFYWILPLALAMIAHCPFAFVSNRNTTGTPRRWMISGATNSPDSEPILSALERIPYFLGANGFSFTNTLAELNAVRSSFDQWQSIPGTSLRFDELGVIPGKIDVNPHDQTNIVFWATDDLLVNGGRDSLFGALSLTIPRVNAENVLLEGDIVLNGVQFDWFTDFDNSDGMGQFVESTILHEIGHFIGLEHSPVGGTTMFARGARGVSTQAGLSSDEVAAARWLYPSASNTAAGGTILGRVLRNGSGVYGAALTAENTFGNLISATVTQAGGVYELPELEPGSYTIRATPLDPPSNNSLSRLVTGNEISPDYANADTTFSATAKSNVVVGPSQTTFADIETTGDTTAIRISRILPPSEMGVPFIAINAPITVRPGLSNLVVGVYSPNALSPGASFSITGDGLSLSAFRAVSGVFPSASPSLNLVSAVLSVSWDATPGLRSFALIDGSELAFANGFLEISPLVPDFDFDGFDDRFQRRYFDPFTGSDADAESDPDGDGLNNFEEKQTGSNPADPTSLLRIEQVVITETGGVVSWQSAPGKVYQLLARRAFDTETWHPVAPPVTARAYETELNDPKSTNDIRFYRVQLVR